VPDLEPERDSAEAPLQARSASVPIAQAGAWVGAAYLVALSGQLVANGIAGRLLGSSGYEAYASATTVIIMVTQLGLFGLQTAAMRDAASMRHGIRPDLGREQLAAIKSLTRFILPVLGLLTALTILIWHQPSGWTASLMMGVGVYLLVSVGAQQRLHANYLRGFGFVKISSFLEGRSGGAMLLAFQALALALVAILMEDPSLAVLLFASGIAVFPSVVLSRRLVARQFMHVTHRWRPFQDLRTTLRRSSGLAAVQAGMLFDTSLDIVLASLVLTATDASYFAGAQRLAMLVIIPSALVQMVVGPTIARRAQNVGEIQHLVRTAATVALLMGALASVPLMFAPTFSLTAVYGNEFSGGATLLTLLAVGYLFRVTAGLGTATLLMTGHESKAAKAYWTGVTLRILASGSLGLLYGAVAFTLASLVITALLFTHIWFSTRRATGMATHPTLRPAWRSFLRTSG
jgi:O-antigen/teichoic acid export membrane protein